jgi:LPXTG-motif cell wall-anchored protein
VNGEVEINDLPNRTYVVVEITPPDGYGLADPTEQTVEVDENETAEVTFVNPEEEEEVEEEPEEPEEEPEPEEPVETEPEPPEAPALPETGGNYLAVVLLGLLLAIGGLIVRRRRG